MNNRIEFPYKAKPTLLFVVCTIFPILSAALLYKFNEADIIIKIACIFITTLTIIIVPLAIVSVINASRFNPTIIVENNVLKIPKLIPKFSYKEINLSEAVDFAFESVQGSLWLDIKTPTAKGRIVANMLPSNKEWETILERILPAEIIKQMQGNDKN